MKRFHLATVGCQMNVLDSELVAAELLRCGYEQVDHWRTADVILFNTCSVRQHAEDKIYSALGRLKELKDRYPERIIGVLGCMAQKDGPLVFRRAAHVDLVVGPGQLGRLAALVQRVVEGAGPQMALSPDRCAASRTDIERSFVPLDQLRAQQAEPAPPQAMVRIMFGCDKFCSYCVVPRVRGPEQSRAAGEIEAEVRGLVDRGCLEVTLLGQTVNSYRFRENGRTRRLSDLLARLHEIAGLARIRFVTNHPRHMTDDLLQAVRDLARVSPYLHVPAQSGSDAVLARMNRGYTAARYREMLFKIRETIPAASITSDFIVGFCGETEEDFARTVELTHEARFKNSFIFKYSPRPGTKAAEELSDDVPYDVKQRRNNALLAVQDAVSEEDNQPFVGRTVEILVEGPSKTSQKRDLDSTVTQLTGRTVCDRIVVFEGPRDLTGRILRVRIEGASAFTLFGTRV